MNCPVCDKSHSNKKYCSIECSSKARIGSKRLDTSERNRINNPIWNPETKAKMIRAITGRVQTPQEIQRRMATMKKLREADPTLNIRQTKKIVELAKNKPIGWPRAKKLALKRDNYTCQSCGASDKRLVIHHKDHNGRSLRFIRDMNNELSNLISLCYSCHNTQHMWPVRKQKRLMNL